MDVTLLEVHLPNAQFPAPFAGNGETAEPDAAGERPRAPPHPGLVVLAVVVVVALARALRRSGHRGEGPP